MIRAPSASGRGRSGVRAPASLALLLAAAALFAAGCGNSYWYGTGPGAEATVTTPSGVQAGLVKVAYTLTGEVPTTNVTVSFSTNGTTFRDATEGPGSDGTTNLAVSL